MPLDDPKTYSADVSTLPIIQAKGQKQAIKWDLFWRNTIVTGTLLWEVEEYSLPTMGNWKRTFSFSISQVLRGLSGGKKHKKLWELDLTLGRRETMVLLPRIEQGWTELHVLLQRHSKQMDFPRSKDMLSLCYCIKDLDQGDHPDSKCNSSKRERESEIQWPVSKLSSSKTPAGVCEKPSVTSYWRTSQFQHLPSPGSTNTMIRLYLTRNLCSVFQYRLTWVLLAAREEERKVR